MKFLIIICCFFWVSCNFSNEEKTIDISMDSTITYSMSLSVQKKMKIKIPKDKYSYYHSTAIYDGRYFLGVNQNKPNVIDVYDIQEQKFITEIKVNNNILNDRISGIYVQNLDSIYFCQSSPNSIYLINSKGQLINSWDSSDLAIKINHHDILSRYGINFTTFLHQFRPVVHENRYLYIGIDPQNMYKKNPKIERVGVYDLVNKEWVDFISKYSDLASCIDGLEYTYDLEQPYIEKSDKYIVISYPMEHYIFVFDLNTNKYINKFPAYSKEVLSLPYPQKPELMESCQKSWNFRIQTPFYGNLYYHKDKRLYTRVVYYPQELIDSKGYMNGGKDRTASIIILDESFNIIGETKFENGGLGVNTYLPTPTGMVIAEQMVNDTCDVLNFDKVLQFKN